MSKPFFEEEFKSDLQVMGGVLERAVAALVQHGWVAKENAMRARLCLEEALVNAIRHGNQGDASRSVRVQLTEEGGRCLVRVYDEGGGFRPEAIELPPSDACGGRGICLIKHYADYLIYNEEEHCLEMALRPAPCESGEEDHDAQQ
ncbi:MAG: ATP-binding protein [Candidatus Hydrogenedentota bacterium]